MEPEPSEQLPQAVPEKKKRTLTEKQIKNLELMRQKKMAKKKAVEMIEESVRNSAREPEKSEKEAEKEDEISNLKNELYELKEQMTRKKRVTQNAKPKPKRPPKVSIGVWESDEEAEKEQDSYQYVNPYLNQLVRGR
jgi:hypothetical protein